MNLGIGEPAFLPSDINPFYPSPLQQWQVCSPYGMNSRYCLPSPPQQWCCSSSPTEFCPQTTMGEMRLAYDLYRPPTWKVVRSVCCPTPPYHSSITSHQPHYYPPPHLQLIHPTISQPPTTTSQSPSNPNYHSPHLHPSFSVHQQISQISCYEPSPNYDSAPPLVHTPKIQCSEPKTCSTLLPQFIASLPLVFDDASPLIRPPKSQSSFVAATTIPPLVAEQPIVHSHLWKARCKQIDLKSTTPVGGVKKPRRLKLGTIAVRKTRKYQKQKPKLQYLISETAQDLKVNQTLRSLVLPIQLDHAISTQSNHNNSAAFGHVSGTYTNLSFMNIECSTIDFVFGDKLTDVDVTCYNEKRKCSGTSVKQHEQGPNFNVKGSECRALHQPLQLAIGINNEEKKDDVEYVQNLFAPNIDINGLSGLAGISNQRDFGQSFVTQGPAATQQPGPPELMHKEPTVAKMCELRESLTRSIDTFISEFKEELRLLMHSRESLGMRINNQQNIVCPRPFSISATNMNDSHKLEKGRVKHDEQGLCLCGKTALNLCDKVLQSDVLCNAGTTKPDRTSSHDKDGTSDSGAKTYGINSLCYSDDSQRVDEKMVVGADDKVVTDEEESKKMLFDSTASVARSKAATGRTASDEITMTLLTKPTVLYPPKFVNFGASNSRGKSKMLDEVSNYNMNTALGTCSVVVVSNGGCAILEQYIEGSDKGGHYLLQLCFLGFNKKVCDKGSGNLFLTDEQFVLYKDCKGKMRLLLEAKVRGGIVTLFTVILDGTYVSFQSGLRTAIFIVMDNLNDTMDATAPSPYFYMYESSNGSFLINQYPSKWLFEPQLSRTLSCSEIITPASFLCILVISCSKEQGYQIILGIATFTLCPLHVFTLHSRIIRGIIFAILSSRAPLIRYPYARLQFLFGGSFTLMFTAHIESGKLRGCFTATLLLDKVERVETLMVVLTSSVQKYCSDCMKNGELDQSCRKFGLCNDQFRTSAWSNLEMCKLIDLFIICVQALILLAVVFQALGSLLDYNCDGDYVLGKASLFNHLTSYRSSEDYKKIKSSKVAYYPRQQESSFMMVASVDYSSSSIDQATILAEQARKISFEDKLACKCLSGLQNASMALLICWYDYFEIMLDNGIIAAAFLCICWIACDSLSEQLHNYPKASGEPVGVIELERCHGYHVFFCNETLKIYLCCCCACNAFI